MKIPLEGVMILTTQLHNEKQFGLSLNKDFSFDNFIRIEENDFAVKVTKQIAAKRPCGYDTLLLYGKHGSRKTHLMQAIGNECLKIEATVFYLRTCDFLDELVESIKTTSLASWKQAYYTEYLLLLDDIQFLADKPASQEMLFFILDYRMQNKKQTVLSGNQSIAQMDFLIEALSSRLKQGVNIEHVMIHGSIATH